MPRPLRGQFVVRVQQLTAHALPVYQIVRSFNRLQIIESVVKLGYFTQVTPS